MSVRRRSTARLRGLRWAGAGFALLWWGLYAIAPRAIALVFAIAWTLVAVFWFVRLKAVTVAQQLDGEDPAPLP
jgi:hypothetical protein